MTDAHDSSSPVSLSIEGECDDRFQPVAVVFEENFRSRGELGAAITVYVDGHRVVDLWGGYADGTTLRPWNRDTPTLVFSCTKGIVTVCLMMLVDRGQLKLDAPVVDYWPEFGGAGKQSMTVRTAINHSGGLPYLDRDLTLAEIAQWDPVIDALEAQAPVWPPGKGFAYHAQTFGFIAGELIRRVSGKHPRQFLEDEISRPLGVGTSLGVHDAADLPALARIEAPLLSADLAAQALADQAYAEHPFWAKDLTMNGALPFPSHGDDVFYNSTAVRTAELPSVNVITTARDMAKIYAACVTEVDGVRLISDATAIDAMRYQSGGGVYDFVLPPSMRWGSGFLIDSPPARPMMGPTSFGHDGAGGLLGCANLDKRASLAYVTNQMGGIPDERANELSLAAAAVLAH